MFEERRGDVRHHQRREVIDRIEENGLHADERVVSKKLEQIEQCHGVLKEK